MKALHSIATVLFFLLLLPVVAVWAMIARHEFRKRDRLARNAGNERPML